MLSSLYMYLPIGACVGLLAGMLGVGGGLLVVPIVVFSLQHNGASAEHIQHLALGTSFATIVFTSISSFISHHRRGAVIWPVVVRFSPGVVIGVILGGYVASYLNTRALQVFFLVFIFYAASQMLLNIKPKPARELPGAYALAGSGGIIGFISSLVGIGGGNLIVPYLSWCNVPMHRAVGTSSAVGWPLAVTGAITYMYNGWQLPGLPEYALGFIYLPALLGIAVVSILTAPLGAAISHRLPVPVLRKFFAVFLIIMGLRMVWSMF